MSDGDDHEQDQDQDQDQEGDQEGDQEQEQDQELTGIDAFEQANADLQTRLAELDDDAPGYAIDAMRAVEDFLERIARADDVGPLVKEQAAAIASEHEGVTKKMASRELSSFEREHEREQRERPEVTAIVREQVDRIEALGSTETDGAVRYRVVFRGGDPDPVVVTDDELWSSKLFRRALTRAIGAVPVFDPENAESWEDVVNDLVREKLEWHMDAVGPREQVIERIRGLVEQRAAYTDRKRAHTESGVWIAEPDADTIWIDSARISEKAKEFDEELAAIRWEMDNRDLRAGSSEQKRAGENRPYWWPLKRDRGFEPKRIEVDSDGDDGDDGVHTRDRPHDQGGDRLDTEPDESVFDMARDPDPGDEDDDQDQEGDQCDDSGS